MTNYDYWVSTNPAETEQDRHMKDFELWLDRLENEEEIANKIKVFNKPLDLACYVAEEGLDWDYPDQIVEKLKDDFPDELFDYFINNEV